MDRQSKIKMQVYDQQYKIGILETIFSDKTFAGLWESLEIVLKKRWKTSALNSNQELPQNTNEFNQKIQSSTQKGQMNNAIYRQLLGT